MELNKVAESIVDGLSNLENKTNTLAKIADSYREMQVEIVLNHLRQLTSIFTEKLYVCPYCELEYIKPEGAKTCCKGD